LRDPILKTAVSALMIACSAARLFGGCCACFVSCCVEHVTNTCGCRVVCRRFVVVGAGVVLGDGGDVVGDVAVVAAVVSNVVCSRLLQCFVGIANKERRWSRAGAGIDWARGTRDHQTLTLLIHHIFIYYIYYW
jgi:hypothetical protein